MSKIALTPNATGTGVFTISSPATNTDRTLTLPDEAGTIITTAGVPSSAMPAGSVLQVVSTTKTDTFSSTAANAFTDITGLSVSITPTSSSSKIMVFCTVQGINANTNAYFSLVRDAAAIGVGGASGSRSQVSSENIYKVGTNMMAGSSFQFLDSPVTTSSTTYKIQFITDGGTTYVNRTVGDIDALYTGRSQSTITVMEIAG
jgi:hypothetical protein